MNSYFTICLSKLRSLSRRKKKINPWTLSIPTNSANWLEIRQNLSPNLGLEIWTGEVPCLESRTPDICHFQNSMMLYNKILWSTEKNILCVTPWYKVDVSQYSVIVFPLEKCNSIFQDHLNLQSFLRICFIAPKTRRNYHLIKQTLVRIILLQEQRIETAGRKTESLEIYSLESILMRHWGKKTQLIINRQR